MTAAPALPFSGALKGTLLNWDWWIGNINKLVLQKYQPDAYFTPNVTVIIPAHDEVDFVRKTIVSVQAQDYPFITRIIVVDSWSSDGTGDLARAMSQHDHRIMVLHDGYNGHNTKSQAQNVGVEYVRTPLMVTIDADTILEKSSISKMVPFFQDPSTFAVCGFVVPKNIQDFVNKWPETREKLKRLKNRHVHLKRLHARKRPLGFEPYPQWKEARREWQAFKKSSALTLWELGRLIDYVYGLAVIKPAQNRVDSILVASGCNTMFRTEMVRELGGFDPRTMAEDMDMSWLGKSGVRRKASGKKERLRVYYAPEALCYPVEPKNFQTLERQLDRWYRGLFQCINVRKWNLFPMGMKMALLTYFYVIYGLSAPFFAIMSLWFITTGNYLQTLALVLPTQAALYIVAVYVPIFRTLKRLGLWGVSLKALGPGFVVQNINQFIFMRSFVLEVIMGKKLSTWHKGHGEVASTQKA